MSSIIYMTGDRHASSSSSMATASWLLCMMMLFIVFETNEVHGQCLELHKSLLLQMKNGFTGIPWSKKLLNWDSSKDCCAWPGVGCSRNGYVTGLDLGGEGIQGGLSDASPLFDLQYLTSLNLSLNYFEEAMPSAFGKLSNLVHLDLSRAGFQGKIPIEISNLTRLVTLDLSSLYDFGLKVDNPSLGMVVGNLSNLLELRLNDVDLTTQASEWCQVMSSSVPHLQVLSLRNSRLSGPIHASLQTLQSLSVIDLSSNYFSVPFPQFFHKFKNLNSLSMGNCELSGKFPDKILEVQTLRFLDLSDNYLTPSNLPITFKHSSSLETLELARTKFSNIIPESIGKVKMLTKLDLSQCSLVGHIPESLSQLRHLVHLDLSANSLTGSVPSLSLARNLKELNLGDNRLNGSLLSTDWKQLSQLENVLFRGNSLSGSIPASMFGTPSLQTLYLLYNHFTGFTKESIQFPSSQLTHLSISHNDLRGKFPAFIFGLQGLVDLDLSHNSFSDILHMKPFSEFKNLESIDLSNSNLSVDFVGIDSPSFLKLNTLFLASCHLKEIPAFLKTSATITNVDLSDNQIHGSIPSWIWNISSLETLGLSQNSLRSIETPKTSTSRIEMLDLSSNWLHGELPNLPSARSINLSSNHFNSTISSIISEFPSTLEFLYLASNNLYGIVPASICKLEYLYLLDLTENYLSGAIPECLPSMESTRVLSIGRNNITGIIPDTFTSLCSLLTMDLNANSLLRDIPNSLRSCTHLQDLNLSYNKFQGRIPYDLGYLQSLVALNMSRNSLTGPIPTSFGNLTSLDSLDLAKNGLSGTIPLQLAALKLLSFLNVSYNQLEGRIPEGPQFQKFTEASFQGNKGLCGFPLKKTC